MSDGTSIVAKRGKKKRSISVIDDPFSSVQLETLHKSKLETLNEKELRIGERMKAELEVTIAHYCSIERSFHSLPFFSIERTKRIVQSTSNISRRIKSDETTRNGITTEF